MGCSGGSPGSSHGATPSPTSTTLSGDDVFAPADSAGATVTISQPAASAYANPLTLTWIQGGKWVHALGNEEKICLYAGNQAGFTAIFHYVHVSTVQ